MADTKGVALEAVHETLPDAPSTQFSARLCGGTKTNIDAFHFQFVFSNLSFSLVKQFRVTITSSSFDNQTPSKKSFLLPSLTWS